MDSNFESILDLVDSFGKFQKRLLYFVVFPITIYVSITVNIIVFQLYVPDHWCKVVGIDGSPFYSLEEWKNIAIPKTTDGSYEKCLQYETLISDETSVIRASNKTTGCQIGWDHDYDLFVETVATEEGWLCEKAQYSTHILAINLAGMAIGSILLPLIADLTTGRKNMFFISIFIHLVFNLALLGVKQFYLHAIFRFLAMLASQSLFQMPYVVTVEMLNPDSRTFASFLSFVAWTVGMCLTALLAYLIPHWWFLVLISSVPSIGLLGFWRLFPESPRWLLSKGKLDEAAQILMKVAVGNGRNGVTIDKLKEKLEAHWEIEKNLKIKLKQIVDFPKLCKNSIVIFLLGCFTWMAYACILLNLNILPNRYFLNFFILSIIELPSNVVGFLSANYLGRKMSALLTYAAAAIFSLICVFSLKERILLLCMVGFVKLFMTEGIYLLYVISGEIFPTPIRSTGVGMMVVIGTLGTIASPYIIEAGEVFQFSVMLALSLACVALSLLLPETLGLPLPQTLQDAEALGEGRSFFKWIHHWNVNDVNARSNQGQIYSLSAPKL